MNTAEYILLYVVDVEEYASYTLNEGEKITPEAEPTKEGYTFSACHRGEPYY